MRNNLEQQLVQVTLEIKRIQRFLAGPTDEERAQLGAQMKKLQEEEDQIAKQIMDSKNSSDRQGRERKEKRRPEERPRKGKGARAEAST